MRNSFFWIWLAAGCGGGAPSGVHVSLQMADGSQLSIDRPLTAQVDSQNMDLFIAATDEATSTTLRLFFHDPKATVYEAYYSGTDAPVIVDQPQTKRSIYSTAGAVTLVQVGLRSGNPISGTLENVKLATWSSGMYSLTMPPDKQVAIANGTFSGVVP
jgi:hypothetical protein